MQVNDQVHLNAAIYNVLNKDFGQFVAYRNGATLTYTQAYANLQEPRRLWISATMDF